MINEIRKLSVEVEDVRSERLRHSERARFNV
jgi:hypothetical protein